jgi:hypothetical protein
VKAKSIKTTAMKTGTAALALCLAAGNAAMARCASPEEMTALKVAAMRQQLMVAGLTCHQASSFNRFVSSSPTKTSQSDFQVAWPTTRISRGRP